MEYPVIDENINTVIKNLGSCKYSSPISGIQFFSDQYKIVLNIEEYNILRHLQDQSLPKSVEVGGPRKKIFFHPEDVKAAIVTCGGLCPGLNNVIRDITMCLHYNYNINEIYGIPYGYRGFIEEYGHGLKKLTAQNVDDLHQKGGTILASSRGNQPVEKVVDFLEKNGFNQVYAIGGDGTLKGAHHINEEIERRKLKITVVGIPKTIDNDIAFVSRSFGFETAVSKATEAVMGAHIEAKGAYNGIGIVKLMGRESGFIAAATALASNEANFVLIPEMDFDMEGEKGFLNRLKERMELRDHALIIAAEGAGQRFVHEDGYDISGNKILGDIGLYLKSRIQKHFKENNISVSIKYIDPSYIIRSVAANANDSVYCTNLAHTAVHAAMAGKTDVCVGLMHDKLIHLPIPLVTSHRKKVDLRSSFWQNVIMSTGMKSLKN